MDSAHEVGDFTEPRLASSSLSSSPSPPPTYPSCRYSPGSSKSTIGSNLPWRAPSQLKSTSKGLATCGLGKVDDGVSSLQVPASHSSLCLALQRSLLAGTSSPTSTSAAA